jgi:hypothetical protein
MNSLREAIAGLLATPLRYTACWVFVLVGLVGGPSMAAELASASVNNEAEDAGNGTYLSIAAELPTTSADTARADPKDQAASISNLPAARCEALNRLAGITAGAVQSAGQASVATAPSGSFALYVATPTFIRLLGGRADAGAQLYAGAQTATELGIRVGSNVQVRHDGVVDSIHDVQILPTGRTRTEEFDRALILIASPEQVSGECWLEAPGVPPNSFAAIAGTLLPGATVKPFLQIPSVPTNPVARYAQLTEVALTLLAALSWLVLRRQRRGEVVLRRVFGETRSGIALIDLIQWLTMIALTTPAALVLGGTLSANPDVLRWFATVFARDCALATLIVGLSAIATHWRTGWELRTTRSAE